ncbi:MAG: S41 family peptidase [Planctomycetota bacterium]
MTMLAALALVCSAQAAPALPQNDEARWLRYVSISPDGQHVAFSYAGDLWVAPVSDDGAVEATLLTTHVGYESHPIWAPDSKTLAFSANWYGQPDVFVTSLDRAPAQRLTFHSSSDTPWSFSPDGTEVWFSSRRQDKAIARIGSSVPTELYAIATNGGAPRQLLTTAAEHVAIHPSGKMVLYQDLKSYENQWRKHHVSSHACDLWSWNPTTGKHDKLTQFRGEDRDPAWLPDGESFVFLSERGGSFNVWSASVAAPEAATQRTQHTIHPVRFLSASTDGTLAYTWNGEIYIMRPGKEPRRLPVMAKVDQRTNTIERMTFRADVDEMAVSPNEDEVAFVVRGEIFVTSLEHGSTKRITQTPEQERSVTWGKDGRTLHYASERDGSWNLYSTSIKREQEESFSIATLLKEETLLANEREAFQPVISPDGKHLAYLVDREAIHVMDLATKKHREVVSDEWNYSYADGDISFAWSPDSRWLTFGYSPFQRFSGEIGVKAIDGSDGEIVNLSTSGYEEGSPRFAPDGKSVIYTSGRFGQQEHSGRGGQSDVFAVYLSQAAYDEAQLTWEELELRNERKKKAKAKAKKASADNEKSETAKSDDTSSEPDEKDKDEAVEPLDFERRRLNERRRRVTMQSAPIGDVAMTPDGEAVIYMAEIDGKWDLWTSHLRDRKTQRLATIGDRGGDADLHLSKDGKTLILRTSAGKLMQAKITTGKHDLPDAAKPKPIAFTAEMTVDGPAERAHLFEHVWRQMREKFYRSDLHGVDWDLMKRDYASFLPHIHNGYDFAELLSEMLGETNASHTGASYRERSAERDDTATLGLIYGELTDAGMQVDEVVKRGPADRSDSKIAEGATLTAIDGEPLTPATNPWRLLDRKSDKPVLVAGTTKDGTAFEEVLKPLSGGAERELMYQRWIDRCESLVDELSKGRIGYVHVRGMNDSSYREVYEQVLGRCSEKKALIVDTRWNGGGWLHDQLVTFLGGKQYCVMVPRDKEPGRFGGEPLSRWARPVCVLQNEGNYSDAHFFPYSFKTLGLGKLIGAPVAGTTTAVWWETLFDGATRFGIPELGVQDMQGNYLENQELFPDIEVYNDPESTAAGRDLQLERAVAEMLRAAELAATDKAAGQRDER